MMRKRLFRRSIYIKLVLLLMLLSGLSVLLTAIVLSSYEMRAMKHAELRKLESFAYILMPNLTASVIFDDAMTARELIQPLLHQPSIDAVIVYDSEDQIFASVESADKTEVLTYKPRLISTPLVMDSQHYGKLVVHSNNYEEDKHSQFYTEFLMASLGIILLVTLVLSSWLARRFVNPIILLTDTANKITSSNNYSLRAVTQSKDELGKLTRCFNDMLKNIELRDKTLESKVHERTAELRRANEELHNQAYRDSLSGLPNRRFMLELLKKRAVKDNVMVPFSLFFLDLDGFKEINDSLGHDYGDALICAVAKRLQNTIRQTDFSARLGGDEFTVLINDISDRETLSRIAEEIKSSLSRSYEILGETVHVTASIGICTYPYDAQYYKEVMRCADLAMYEAKSSGRNTYCFFEPVMLNSVLQKRTLLEDLRCAIARNELELCYQPIINTESGLPVKAEALLRWNHPTRGVVFPDEFIPIAEENGLIDSIGLWVAKESVSTVRHIRENYLRDFGVSFNVSPLQLKNNSQWLGKFIDVVSQANLGAKALTIEITENVLIEADSKRLSQLLSLKNEGVEVAIDDFGVGYSSLSYLQQYSVDTIKIDQSFVKNLTTDSAEHTLCLTMINMAKNLNMNVVAEGVEHSKQLEILAALNCDYVQGYLFSTPLLQAEFEVYISNLSVRKLSGDGSMSIHQ